MSVDPPWPPKRKGPPGSDPERDTKLASSDFSPTPHASQSLVDDPRQPTFVVCDHRRDGRLRIISEYQNEATAHQAALLLRWAGSAAQVMAITAIQTTMAESAS